MTEAATLLPAPDQVQLIQMEATTAAITAVVATKASSATCPFCGKASRRIHSRTIRSVLDVPWHGVPFRLRLHVRRFFCDEPSCARKTFVERLPGLVAPYARRTDRLAAWMRAVGVAVGGEAGTRLLRQLGLAPASPDTLLRHIRRAPAPASRVAPAPRVVGVDDWCFRRGQRYGAIVVDLERHQVLDLLPDREADTVAGWLRAHPSVEVVSRDRGGSFAEGASRGAPQAIQVADRFHVLKNLLEAFQRVLGHEHEALRAAAERVAGAPQPSSTRPLTTLERQRREQTHARRQERYDTVRRLRDEGKPIHEIAAELHMGHNTIRRLLNAGCYPETTSHQRQHTVLSDFESSLRERWNTGEQNGQQLVREIREQGYRGSKATVYALLGRWRTGPRHSGPYAHQNVPAQPIPPPIRTAPRAVSWLLLHPEADLDTQEAAYVTELLHGSTTVATTQEAVQAFFTLVRERRADQLDVWLEHADASGVRELAAFAEGIRRDYAAVRAGCELIWSQGQVEGQVNRLKFVKRSMYGRAKLDLLRRRVLEQAVA